MSLFSRKMHITINYLLYFVAIPAVMLMSGCDLVGNSEGNSDSIKWVGEVAPGEYYGSYDFHLTNETANVAIQLSINDDGSFDLLETWKGGGCSEGTRAYSGILRLHEEIYNGTSMSWYTLYGSNPDIPIHAEYSLSENLELRTDINDTYQAFSTSKMRCVLHK